MNDFIYSEDFIQASRTIRVRSPLGEDALLPERVVVEEEVGGLFRIEMTVRAKQDITPNELIGKLVDVELEVAAGEIGEESIYRPFNGLLTEIHAGPKASRGLRSYTFILRPQFWLLSQRTDHRIWMDQNAIDVLEILLREHDIPGPDVSGVIGTVPKLHYSVQHGESDLDYVKRRLEEFGLFWWFSHKKGQHRVHVANHPSGWLQPSPAAQGESKVRLAMGSTDRNHINSWSQHFAYIPGARAGADWNFETPRVQVKAALPSLVSLPDNAKREVYEYPSRTATIEEAEKAGKLRMQASEADHERIHGRSNVRVLETGRRFVPYEEGNPDASYEEYVVIKAVHRVVDRSYETSGDEPEYQNSFEAVPSRVPLTPHRTTKRPRIEGTQVAIVAGPEGEEIHPDQYGRIKLWFPWDRKAKKDGTDTCWVRVAQNWAGSAWGGQIIPRIGMEVMVAFVDGDPDRPLITGVVPNARQTVPYDLPAHKTRSVFRTQTHKGNGFNELRFEDDLDKEEIFMHAQKDMNVEVLNDHSKRVGRDKAESVVNDKSIEVGGDHDEVVSGNMSISVGENALSNLLMDKTKLIFDKVGTALNKLKIPDPFNFAKGNFQLFVEKNHSQVVGIGSSEVVGGAKSTVVGHTFQTTVGKSHSVIVRGRSDTDIGKIMNIRVGDQLTIKVGENSMITMSKEGNIVIQGKHIALKAGKITQN